jgi:hypothetical protein
VGQFKLESAAGEKGKLDAGGLMLGKRKTLAREKKLGARSLGTRY